MEKIMKANTWEYQASIFGAGFIGFGLSYLFKDVLGGYSITVMILGIVLHGWGMYSIHKRSNQ